MLILRGIPARFQVAPLSFSGGLFPRGAAKTKRREFHQIYKFVEFVQFVAFLATHRKGFRPMDAP
jgi:hypothetical protein